MNGKLIIVRVVHQDTAKSAVIEKLTINQVLIIIDWAMKYLPVSYQETQRDWFGKKGKSWHFSVAITKGEDGEIKVEILNLYLRNSFIGVCSRVFSYPTFCAPATLAAFAISSLAVN